MALHMVDDPQDQEEYDDNSGNTGGSRNTGGSSSGGLFSLLPMLFGLFGRGGGGKGGGKGGLLLLLLIAGAAYFFFNKGGTGGGAVNNIVQTLFSQSGYSYDPEQFRQASVYEGLEDNNAKNPLPESISLAAYAPQRMNQGKQGSCVAWSATYAARTILEASASNADPNTLAYSPAFMYNNIALEDCQGSYLLNAMKFMQKAGAVPFQDFPYNENDCRRQATNTLYEKAAENKIHGFQRLTETDDVNNINIRAIKEHLAKDAPVVIGMMVGGSFMQGMMGQKVWRPTGEDRQQRGFGGHAMCVIGYDDRVQGGAFEIMNSWGPEWGQDGIGFVRYADFKEFVREAYGIDPLPKKGAALNAAMECLVGLVSNDTRQNIALKPSGSNTYKTVTPIKKGARFKIEIKNNTACYIYIFTPDVNQKSFVLFPYKPIHSPYCGITGYRLFPKSESIMADDIGNKEVMGIVISKKELDYNAINNAINQQTGASYAQQLNSAFGSTTDKNAQFSAGANGSVQFRSSSADNSVVLTVVEIDKQ
jgi:hypothetical protein